MAAADQSTSAPTKDGEKEGMKWMYERESALIDREKYLLGQKVDKNFEVYTAATSNTPKTALEAILDRRAKHRPTAFQSEYEAANAPSRGLLRVDTVKKEDPLVNIRVKEEKFKQEVSGEALIDHRSFAADEQSDARHAVAKTCQGDHGEEDA